MFDRRHSFRDPVHGFIRVSDEERELLDSGPFQRLRRIRQLGTGCLVYHGAEHSRFGHSLGVLEVATRVLERIKARRPGLAGEDEWIRYEQLLRIAALLHDIGHAPFSHASEELFPRDEHGKLFEHEDYTAAIVLGSEIAEMIDRNFAHLNIAAADVINVYSNPEALGPAGVLLQNIVAGELDADRMDYLARDSLYAGVAYGRYDLDRLLDTITAVEDERGAVYLAVDDDGRYALDAFLLARYHMFLQVYLHEDRRFYDLALIRAIKDMLQAEHNRPTYPPPAEWERFIGLDDVWLQSRLPELASGGHIWAKCLYERRHWKVVAEHISGTLDPPRTNVDPGDWAHIQQEVCETHPNDVLPDDARGKNFRRTYPGPYIGGRSEKGERPKILIWNEKDRAAKLVEDVSGIAMKLSESNIRLRRLYASPERFPDVRSAWDSAAQRHA